MSSTSGKPDKPGKPGKSTFSKLASPPDGYRTIYQGIPLPPFYAAEMIRPYIGKTLWVADSGGRTRCGEVATVPNVREDQAENLSPVEFVDERPLFLCGIVHIAVYDPHGARGRG
ncbi:MAG: hypothetical protein WC869_09455 [Phycisphaerae bacterium]|jgi:hypothetical protein